MSFAPGWIGTDVIMGGNQSAININECTDFKALFDYLSEEFGIIATESQLNEIKYIVLGKSEYLRQANL